MTYLGQVCHLLGIKDKQCLVPALKGDVGSHWSLLNPVAF